ncbi:MAG: MBL fold hydrolase [Spirochaetes bacterium GWF1_51_8]|nr:MAG: MBL fold hydrolase [Spirochaetes bacterium GWF1_51_8]
MAVRKLAEGIFEVGVIHWDRDLFDDLIPLPQGTTYNSYLVYGKDKTVLIDTAEPTKMDVLFNNLDMAGVKKIDYVICQHAEQDHSGSLAQVLDRYPGSICITNQKCRDLLLMHLDVTEEQFKVIADGEKIDIGGRTLEFIFAPWVHWPETMFTYLAEERILFSCDFLGGHLTSTELFVSDYKQVEDKVKLYYAEIMMPFRKNIVNHLKKLEEYKIDMIAPSHGQVHRPIEQIINSYKGWVSDDVKNLVVIPYASTHETVAKMVEYFVDALIARGVNAKPYHVTRSDIGGMTLDLVDAATVVLASPTIISGPHPDVAYCAFLVNMIRPKMKYLSVIYSFAWASKVVEVLTGMVTTIKPEILPPVASKGVARAEALAELDRLADQIAEKHKALGIL